MEVLKRAISGDALLVNAVVPACLLPSGIAGSDPSTLNAVDLEIESGRLRRIVPAGTLEPGSETIDLDGGMVLPTLIDMHTHLDKGHIWSRNPNPDGTFMGALTSVGEDRVANWSAEDVRARMEFSLKCAYAHGTSVVRTHIDSIPPQEAISWPVFTEVRQDWAGRLDLQGVCLFGIDRMDLDDGFPFQIADRMVACGGVLGTVTYMIPRLDEHLDTLFKVAIDKGLDLDFHVDETKDPAAVTLRHIAEAALRANYQGTIVCGHCCSLAQQSDAEIDQTLDLVAEAGIGVVSLPMCNMYLQDRQAGRTPRWRGVTLLHEMRARGIAVAVASDNTRDPFYAYGDLDLIEVYAQATRILHLDHPIGDWISAVSTSPAGMLNVNAGRFLEGAAADLIAFKARSWNELLSRPKGPRDVVRNGTSIRPDLPDYRDLDHLMIEKETAL